MIASLCILVLSVAPQGGGDLTAAVNDSSSPGTVGDTVLSLDEAIRLSNGELELNQLSADEQARVSGPGSEVNRIHLDAAVTPVVTLDSELPVVVGQGDALVIESVSSTRPLLLGGSVDSILNLGTHLVTVRGLALEGGQFGVRVQHSDGSAASPARLIDLELRKQTESGLVISASGQFEGHTTSVLVQRTRLSNVGTGLRLDDTSRSGGLIVVCEDVVFEQVGTAVDLHCSGRDGMSTLEMIRGRSRQCDSVLRVRRAPDSTQDLSIDLVHGDYVADGDVLDIQGSDQGLTAVHHHHSVFRVNENGKAFWVHPRTARFDVHGSECTFDGDVSISAGPFSPRVFQRNCHYLDGTISIDNAGGPPTLDQNRYTNVSLMTLVDNQAPVSLTNSEFYDSDVAGTSMVGGIELYNVYTVGTGIAGNVQAQSPAPSPWIGLTNVEPTDPRLGSTLRLNSTLPMGIGAVWHIGVALDRPPVEDFPFVVYSDINTLIPLPAILIETNTLELKIPDLPELLGLVFHAQAAAFPFLGQPHVPPVHLPIGSLIRIGM